jgi:TRAP-type C4-dicarboxylate transport system substrate-binding protein
MNERMENLMYRAGLTAQGCWDSMDDYDHRAIEKFAELIVRECIDCINETDKGYVFTAQDAGVIGAAHNRSIKTIKEHFGVEE